VREKGKKKIKVTNQIYSAMIFSVESERSRLMRSERRDMFGWILKMENRISLWFVVESLRFDSIE
jgi:hypothetical protein